MWCSVRVSFRWSWSACEANRVFLKVEDVLTLLDTNEGMYAAACSLDFAKAPVFYDTSALRDPEECEHVTQTWPFVRSQESRKAMKMMDPVPVKSCWNGKAME